ncbi:AAA family ATPase [Mycobacterium sp. CBMA293]|uniref:AAA family ATPase n=2 Tax=unclassified Mycolicibacterium TaxID=2636767 RepID=UPI0012DE312C|nr:MULTISPECIES: AAA family ATPase [unclassified Mycolicibacterium]MUL49269.1 AAA family ATPase [Mycolicibacterium sp. CBMA 360]MUL69321.1 AAA family ATPase [Mycolicibacterium sp. CBMA 311]MUL94285.1 AAA family ATPase [Mycolicibacterium sp. CBMA 230]MUM11414.1 AAA family ATPase [Mycolicibacterium sp. CBMA 293]
MLGHGHRAVNNLAHPAGMTPLDWSLLGQAQPATPVIPGLLNEGESGSLVARAGCGKSLLTLELAVCSALGTSVLGNQSRDPLTIMYIDMENPEAELAQRLRAMGHEPAQLSGHPLLYFSFPDLPPLDTVEGGRRLALDAERFEPTLIVLDTISRLVEGKEDSADTWQNLYSHTMLPLRRQGRAVLRLDHQGRDASRGARGSSAKRDDVDVAWIMSRQGNDVTLTRDKGRGTSYPESLVLRRHNTPLRHLPVLAKGRQTECVEALDQLEAPADISRDDAGRLLRSHGHRFNNTDIGAALVARRSSTSNGTNTPPDG